MTFTPQAWPDIYGDQKDFIRDLLAGVETAEAQTLPVTIQKSSEPSQAEFAAAWAALRPESPTIPDYGRMQWFNPAYNQLENSYLRLPEASGLIVDTDHKNRHLPLVLLGSDVAAVTNDTDLTVSDIDQSYRDLLVFVYGHSTAAVTSQNWLFRVNGAATLYYYQLKTITAGVWVGAEGINQTHVPISVPGTTLTGDPNSWMAAMIWIRDYAGGRIPFGHIESMLYNTASGYTSPQPQQASWIRNSAAAVTSVSVTPTTASTIEKNSSLLVYGLE